MAASVSATYDLKLNVAETLALALDNADDPTIQHAITEHAKTIDGTTTPPATKTFSDDIALVAGQATLDLTSLAGPLSTTITFDGLKVQLIKLACPATNTAAITVMGKRGNVSHTVPYNLFGTDNKAVTVLSVVPQSTISDIDGTSADLLDVKTAYALSHTGVITDGVLTWTVEESSDDAAFSAVAAGDLVGAFAGTTPASGMQIVRYIGTKRYIRLATANSGVTVVIPIAGSIISTLDRITVMPGAAVELVTDNESETVDSTHKELVLTGTGTETIEVIIVAG